MTAASAEPAKTDKKDKKKDAPKGAQVPKTGELGLTGGKDGVTKSLDNSKTIKAPVPKELQASAKAYAEALDRIDYHKEDAKKKSEALLDSFLKLGKDMPPKVRVDTDRKAHFFIPEELFSIRHEKKSTSEAVEA